MQKHMKKGTSQDQALKRRDINLKSTALFLCSSSKPEYTVQGMFVYRLLREKKWKGRGEEGSEKVGGIKRMFSLYLPQDFIPRDLSPVPVLLIR